MRAHELTLGEATQVEPTARKTKPAVACHIGNSWAVGVPVALKPTMIGRNKSIGPCAYSRAVPRWIARKMDFPTKALPK